MSPEEKEANRLKVRQSAIARFQSRDGMINWRKPNFWISVTIIYAFVVAVIPRQPVYLGFIPRDNMLALGMVVLSILTSAIGSSYREVINDFTPVTGAEAKRANEQIKSTATLINAAAGTTLSVFVFSEVIKPGEPHYWQLVAALGLAVWFHAYARQLLALLKDEEAAKHAVPPAA